MHNESVYLNFFWTLCLRKCLLVFFLFYMVLFLGLEIVGNP